MNASLNHAIVAPVVLLLIESLSPRSKRVRIKRREEEESKKRWMGDRRKKRKIDEPVSLVSRHRRHQGVEIREELIVLEERELALETRRGEGWKAHHAHLLKRIRLRETRRVEGTRWWWSGFGESAGTT
jgi:phage gp46-like protein